MPLAAVAMVMYALKTWSTHLLAISLDLVATMDPQAAVDLSRDILAKPTIVYEWALAPRKLGRIERSPENDSLLLAETSALVRNPERPTALSVGCLNAFDLLVQLQPADLHTCLASDAVGVQRRQEMDAQQFARSDQRHPVQQEILLTCYSYPAFQPVPNICNSAGWLCRQAKFPRLTPSCPVN